MLEEGQEEILPWQKGLIVSLFKQQKILCVILVIFLVPSFFLALKFLYVGINLNCQSRQTFSWDEIPCRIIEITPHYYSKENIYGFWDPGDPFGEGSETSTRYYSQHYEIQYSYIIQGSSYTSNKYSIPRHYEIVIWDSRQEKCLNSLDSNYEAGQTVNCYINPKKPEQSVLVLTSLSISDYALHLFWPFIVFILYSLIPIYFCKKYRDNRKQLSELITGQKENILKNMDRLADMDNIDIY